MGGDRPLISRFFRFCRRRLALLAAIALGLATWFWFSLPRPLFTDPLAPVLFSAEGRLIDARLAADEQWRFPRVQAAPERFFQVLLEYEDRRFRWHPGVDPLALARALWLNIKNRRVVSGGSTLTMQVIRIARKNRRRTVLEKLREMALAFRLEVSFSKRRILDLYAGHAPFGGNIVGIDAASWFYFGRSPEALSWGEAAFLAVLPNDPGLLGNEARRRLLKKKRDRLLLRLRQRKKLSGLQYSLACSEDIPAGPGAVPRLAPHLLTTLDAAHPKRKLFRSHIRHQLQGVLSEIIRSNGEKLLQRNIRNAAALIIDNRRGTVAAYVGNVTRGRDAEHGQDVDLIQSPRSTGSILKPFLYAAMIQEGGITPLTLIPDSPMHFVGYIPENFDRHFRGAVPARDALAWSLNIPAIGMLREYGIPRFYNLLKKWGMSTLTRPPGGYGLTLILGGAEGTLFEITRLYAGLARLAAGDRGSRTEIDLLPEEPVRPLRMADLGPAAAYLTLEALTEVNRPDEEGFWKQFRSSKWVAWKTGTSFGLRDAWSIGVTPAYTVGVWTGNADGQGNPDLTGLSTSAPIMFEILNALDTGGAFRPPLTWMQELTVCRDSGCLATDLCPAVKTLVPRESHFQKGCTAHRLIHLDRSRRYQVDSSCESVERMVHEPRFVLPPVQEYYYRKYHPEYRTLPPFRPDCASRNQLEAGREVMSLIYPEPETAVFIPIDLDGNPGSAVFEAVHRHPETTIFWHLDETFLTATRRFHQITIQAGPGEHRLVLMDAEGRRLERTFRVLNRGR